MIVAVLAILGVSYVLGRALGGAWFVIFMALMLISLLILLGSMTAARGAYAGLGELFVMVFIWAPILVCGSIGSGIGWFVKAHKPLQ